MVEIDVGDDLFLEVESEGEDGSKLLMSIARVGTVCALDGCSDEFLELVVVDAPVVRTVGSAEVCIGDVEANLVSNSLGGHFFSANDCLIYLVDAVGFVLCIGASGDGRELGELGC